jgi:inner membrane protein
VDNITHTLTGLMLSRAGLNRVSPEATWVLLLAANAPDIDVSSALGGSLTYLHFHRHLTHSLLLLPVLAAACVLAVRVLTRRPIAWRQAYLVALAGVASHLILDLTNVYGVRLLLPFSGRWFRLDITNVVDVWIWSALFLAVVAPLLAKLVQSEMGGAQKRYPGQASAVAALAFLLLYDGSRYILHERAVATLESRIYGGTQARRVVAAPGPFSALRWRGVVETANAYRIQEINLAEEFDAAGGREFFKAEPSDAIDAANQTEAFREFLRFSQYPLWQTSAGGGEDAIRVEAMDLRFGDPSAPGFVAVAELDRRLQVSRAWFTFGKPQPR